MYPSISEQTQCLPPPHCSCHFSLQHSQSEPSRVLLLLLLAFLQLTSYTIRRWRDKTRLPKRSPQSEAFPIPSVPVLESRLLHTLLWNYCAEFCPLDGDRKFHRNLDNTGHCRSVQNPLPDRHKEEITVKLAVIILVCMLACICVFCVCVWL
jgi:hypothetical protein